MAAVALNSLQPNSLSGSKVDLNMKSPMALRTSRTDPSIPTAARRYSPFSEDSSSTVVEAASPSSSQYRFSTPSNNRHIALCKARQRPQSNREHSLISKRLRPDPQPDDPYSSPNSSGRLESNTSSSTSVQYPPLPRDSYRSGRRRHYRNSSMVSQRDANNTRLKRSSPSLRHERAASLGSASQRGSAHFSLSDFSLGKVLGAGGTATVIRAELITPPNYPLRERLDMPHLESSIDTTNDKDQTGSSINVPPVGVNRRHQRRQSERSSIDTDVGLSRSGDMSLSGKLEGKVIEFALKVVQKKALSRRALHYLTREIMIHRAVQSHRCVVSLYDVFEDGAAIYLVQELLKGGDLYSALKRERSGIPELTALEVADQILEALSYMHRHGFAHRDIKPENIMFAERPALGEGRVGTVKLIDFGLACARDPKAPVRERTSAEKCGTIRYAAPEVITDASYIPELADVWSVGVVLYSAIAHRNPYCGKTEKDVLEQIENGGPSWDGKEWEGVSEDTKELIGRLLCRKPTDRPSAQRALRMVRNICANFGSSTTGQESKQGPGKDGKDRKEQEAKSNEERTHAPNIFDGLLALFNGNSKESS